MIAKQNSKSNNIRSGIQNSTTTTQPRDVNMQQHTKTVQVGNLTSYTIKASFLPVLLSLQEFPVARDLKLEVKVMALHVLKVSKHLLKVSVQVGDLKAKCGLLLLAFAAKLVHSVSQILQLTAETLVL